MKSGVLIIFIIASLWKLSCMQSLNLRGNQSIRNMIYKNLACEKFGSDTSFIPSPENSYILCLKTMPSDNLNPNLLTEFFVFSKKTKNIIYEDKIAGAQISWYSDFELLISKQKGIITSPDDKGKSNYIYNFKTSQKKVINAESNTNK